MGEYGATVRRLIFLISIALAGCAGQAPTGSASGTLVPTIVATAAPGGSLSSGALPAPPTAWEQVTSSVGPDGTVSLRMALQGR